MSGFLYRGRNNGDGRRQDRPKSLGHMMDFPSEDLETQPAPQMRSLREFEQHLNDLKKENFSLKLRIYFLEERIQGKYEEGSDHVHRRNIELKVEVESLKQELQERQQLLDQAVSTAESLSNQDEAELQRRCDDRQQEIRLMQEVLETKVQCLQQEAQVARSEAEKMASLADSESQRCLALEKDMVVRLEEARGNEALADKDRVIEELTLSLTQLSEDKSSLTCQVTDLEVRVHHLSSSLRRKEKDVELLRSDLGGESSRVQKEMQKLIEEQQSQMGQYEGAAGQCVGELQRAQLQVQSLQAKIRESDCRNQKLQMTLGEMEVELRSAREEAHKQERHVQNLNDSVNTKETEAAELYRVIEEQNNMLCSLKEFANRNKLTQLQVSGAESVRGQGEALELQASLFRAQLELQASQRTQRQASRTGEDLSRALQCLEHDLQGALEHRENTQRHNQELQMALEKARSEVLERREQQREKEGERLREEEERERTIRELRTSLQTKDQLVQDYSELLELQQVPGQKRDSMLSKLRERVKERDHALERAVDEKFHLVEEKEEEVRRLQLLLREKERDLETQRCVLSNNQETITSLEVLLRGKGAELEQVGVAWRGVQRHQQESEERHAHSLRERDDLISQLQGALHSRTKEAEDLTSALLRRVQAGPAEVLEGLQARLQLKERLFQELLSDRSLQAQEHQAQVQALLSTIASRDQYIKDSAGRLGEVMGEQTSRLQELRRQLTWAPPDGVPGPGPGPGPGAGVELQALQEELQLGLRREREALEDIHNQAAQLEVLSRTVEAKEEIIKDLQLQLVEPSGLPLVERLTQELQALRQAPQASASPRQGIQGHNDYGGGHQRSVGRYL